MLGLKPLKPVRLRKVALFILTLVICSCNGGFFAGTDDGALLGFTFTFFSTATAHDDNEHGDGRRNGGDDGGSDYGGGRGHGGGDGGPENGGAAGGSSHGQDGGGSDWDKRVSDSGRASQAPSYGSGPGSNSGNVSYDAGRNMMKLDLRIGGGGHPSDSLEPEHHWRQHHGYEHHWREHYGPEWEHHWPEPPCHRRHEHEHEKHRHHHGHHDEECEKIDGTLSNAVNGLKQDPSIEEALNRAVNPIFPSNAFFQPSDTAGEPATTDSAAASRDRSAPAQKSSAAAVENTKIPIAGLAFTPNEVLAVGLDPASIERAEALGFRADPQGFVSEASGLIITCPARRHRSRFVPKTWVTTSCRTGYRWFARFSAPGRYIRDHSA